MMEQRENIWGRQVNQMHTWSGEIMTLRQNRKHIRELPKETDLDVPIGQGETTQTTPEDIQLTGRSRYGRVLKANPRYKDYCYINRVLTHWLLMAANER